jgi:hypothetical protein
VFVSVFVRRLRPGKTYQDFLDAWYPDQGFGIPTRGPFVSVNPADDREILVVAFVDLPDVASLEAGMGDVAAQEAVRHERIDAVIESTTLRGIYELVDEFDFSTDATVASGRPTGLNERSAE